LLNDNPGADLVPENLRAVEREVDAHHLTNLLLSRPFGESGWCFLAFCEEWVVREILHAESSGTLPTTHNHAALADNLIVHTKWPLRWLRRTCPEGGSIPRKYDAAMYEAAWQLSKLSMQYLPFESAFTYATLGLITLELEGQRISASNTMRADTRFEAYERLTQPANRVVGGSDAERFLKRVATSVCVEGESFNYEINPRLVQAGLDSFGSMIDVRFVLPTDWQLPGFALQDFVRVARVLFVLATIHFYARMTAARLGCIGLGYARALILMERDELFRRLRRYTGVTDEALHAIVEDLTYGARGILNPDPALQPLIPLLPSTYAIAPNLVINSALERNLSVLLNRLPDKKDAYARLSRQREELSRNGLTEALSALGFRCWHGDVPHWQGASEIDLAIVSDAEQQCLILELKSFIGPAEPREIRDRSEEIRRGIVQVRERKRMAACFPGPLLNVLEIDDCYQLTWVVASETSIGAAYVQAPDVPVVRIRHLLLKLAMERSLVACCAWLEAGHYLPTEGIHYEVIDVKASVGKWTLEWYGIKSLVDDYV
jgi:hypothetical protein